MNRIAPSVNFNLRRMTEKVAAVLSIFTIYYLTPTLVGAADVAYPVFNPSYPSALLEAVMAVAKNLIPILIGIGLVVFLWGVVRYITAGPDETKRTEARNLMVWGIIGLFVMVGVWGLVSLIGYIFGITLGGTLVAIPFI
ncbi:MAG: hypothetical protein AAB814_01285 [Patescibacteria group bacterium]